MPHAVDAVYRSPGNFQNRKAVAYGNASPYKGRRSAVPAKIAISGDWKTASQVSIRVEGLPRDCNARDVYQDFGHFGNIISISVSDSRDPNCLMAHVTFAPFNHPQPGELPLWQRGNLAIPGSGDNIEAFLLPPKTFTRGPKYPNIMKCDGLGVDFGFTLRPGCMATMKNFFSQDTKLQVDVERRELSIFFSLTSEQLGETACHSRSSTEDSISSASSQGLDSNSRVFLKLVIPFAQLDQIWSKNSTGSFADIIIPSKCPPLVFRQKSSKDIIETMAYTMHWSYNKAFQRLTDILPESEGRKTWLLPVNFNRDIHLVDLGAWTTYRIRMHHNVLTSGPFSQIKEALKDHNIHITPSELTIEEGSSPGVWGILNESLKNSAVSRPASGLDEMLTIALPWQVRYQLEVCMSQGILNPHNISFDFLAALAGLGEKAALRRLEHIADTGKRLFDPISMFKLPLPTVTNISPPRSHVLQQSVVITPSSVIFASPAVEQSNRITRRYAELAKDGRFLRVRFSDEKTEGKIFAAEDDQNDPLYNRVLRVLRNGIIVGGRHFIFLASGNSQFKEHGAYFVAVNQDACNRIRLEMGDFCDIKIVAKHAARIGQCFSTTWALPSVGKPRIEEIPDVQRNEFIFTDGVGKISLVLARMIANDLKIRGPTPSAFQFRLGGCKGVLAVWQEVVKQEIHIRKSQYKFPSDWELLEIIRPAVWGKAQLNRQLILLLSALGVPDSVFLRKMQKQLASYKEAMSDPRKALEALQKRIDPNAVTLTIADLIYDGFMAWSEPFTISLLRLWHAWSQKRLKEKAAIDVEEGAFLMGCTDETGTLRGHYDSSQNRYASEEERIRTLPEVFLQIPQDPSDPSSPFKVVEGLCVVARNPSLHPGDIRVVRAVDNVALRHLKNVVVFPQTGDRDLPSMCSGGDLDGDDYIIIWDKQLLPPLRSWNLAPMKAPATVTVKKDENDPVTTEDIMRFFVNHMKNDFLGRIAVLWQNRADYDDEGASSYSCKALARLHSKAVDFAKTGDPASASELACYRMPRGKVPHFAASARKKPQHKVYHSDKILGQLFDQVEDIEFEPLPNLPFDARILNACPDLDGATLAAAAGLKQEYDDAMRRIMAQYDIKTEFEIWTQFILNHNGLSKDYELHIEIGRACDALKHKFVRACIVAAGGHEHDDVDLEVLGPFLVAMYKVTALEVKEKGRLHDDDDLTPLVSFPWLFPRELGKIAKSSGVATPNKPALSEAVGRGATLPPADARKGDISSLGESILPRDSDGKEFFETEKPAQHSSITMEDKPGARPLPAVPGEYLKKSKIEDDRNPTVVPLENRRPLNDIDDLVDDLSLSVGNCRLSSTNTGTKREDHVQSSKLGDGGLSQKTNERPKMPLVPSGNNAGTEDASDDDEIDDSDSDDFFGPGQSALASLGEFLKK